MILKEKKANITLITVGVVMFMFMPLMGVLYDISMARIYTQDLKNIQDISGIGCLSKGGGGQNIGVMDPGTCGKLITNLVKENLKGEAGNWTSPPNENVSLERFGLRQGDGWSRRNTIGNGPGKLDVSDVPDAIHVESSNGGRTICFRIEGAKYHPVFLTAGFMDTIRGYVGSSQSEMRKAGVDNISSQPSNWSQWSGGWKLKPQKSCFTGQFERKQ